VGSGGGTVVANDLANDLPEAFWTINGAACAIVAIWAIRNGWFGLRGRPTKAAVRTPRTKASNNRPRHCRSCSHRWRGRAPTHVEHRIPLREYGAIAGLRGSLLLDSSRRIGLSRKVAFWP
jgi:hypothetical protein